MVVFFGFLALTLDIGRLSATHTEFQSFADNVALAAAGELDGKNDAITRATAAAANMISDSQTFANGSNTLSGGLELHADVSLRASGVRPYSARRRCYDRPERREVRAGRSVAEIADDGSGIGQSARCWVATRYRQPT